MPAVDQTRGPLGSELSWTPLFPRKTQKCLSDTLEKEQVIVMVCGLKRN